MKMSYITLLAAVLLLGCNNTEHAEHHHAIQEKTGKYTCSMHPQILQDHPGTCPICGMELVEVSPSKSGGQTLMLTDRQLRLANITTAKATQKTVGETVIVNGSLTVNQESTQVVSSRASGRIEKLYLKETGHAVKKGQPLYTLYSEALLTLQSEYLLAKEQYEALGSAENRYAGFLSSAKEKLLRYGLTDAQINKLDSRAALRPSITFLSPASGIVTEVKVLEGEYIAEGAPLYRMEDISTLWVEAQLYPHETALVKTGDKIQLEVGGAKPASVEATVTFLSPAYQENSQITIMRARIANEDLLLKPGQQAQIFFTHSSHKAIAVPPDAVIRDKRGSRVFVQSGRNTFLPRKVETGITGVDLVEITAGIDEGDTVVITGSYLLYAELMLKGSADLMENHQH